MDRNQRPQGTRYRTANLYYAAFLKTVGVPMVGIDREGPKCFFVFEGEIDDGRNSLNSFKRAFFDGSAKVSARQYADDIKAMKALVFA